MKAEELLKPRFEIIADFPNNHYGKIGTILDRNWSKYPDDDESKKPIWRISDFTHLFRKLNWWEYRKVEEMPEKLICKAIPGDTEIIKIQEWDMNILVGWIDKEKRSCASLNSFNPKYGYFPVD